MLEPWLEASWFESGCKAAGLKALHLKMRKPVFPACGTRFRNLQSHEWRMVRGGSDVICARPRCHAALAEGMHWSSAVSSYR